MSTQPLMGGAQRRIAIPVRVEPKVFFANERTFLSWLNFSILLGGLAVGLMNFGDKVGRISGGIFTFVALSAMMYALITFHWRARKIRNREAGPYDDRFGPTVLCMFMLAAVVVNFYHTPFKTEFAVSMSCDSCVQDVSKVLQGLPEVQRFDIDLDQQRVVVEGTAPPSRLSRLLKDTGRTVIVRGQGVVNGTHAGAAVCIFDMYSHPAGTPKPKREPKGLARLVQIDNQTCLIDITVEGLSPGKHGIAIHECGDISNGCESTGGHYNPTEVDHGDMEKGHVGDLGNVEVDKDGWGDLVLESNRIKVWDIIGRSMVVAAGAEDGGKSSAPESKINGNSGPGILAGIVARRLVLLKTQKPSVLARAKPCGRKLELLEAVVNCNIVPVHCILHD
ncbi:hypothetical protein BZG36_03538 [Bifiguratus adelaidae]|uniref:Superoxide dismutase 1 copper chaperone n=1 Tax=Bifiguratus adelaidae TaxID=1938954 RepID=A0A261XZ80_9FUNG|nr:hypothetical protein BZG36_03538 [Bifiguratus adelaidae]